jgi:copper chaperone CopZ
MIKVEVLYIRECPNHAPMLAAVKDIILGLGLSATVHEREIRDEQDATRVRFRGSPTLLINGHDLEPDEGYEGPFSLCCRMYGGKGLPPREQIEAALLGVAGRDLAVGPGTRAPGRFSLLAPFGGVVSAGLASACCWLPLLLVALGVSAGSFGAVFATLRPYVLVFGGAASGVALYVAFRAGPVGDACGCESPLRRTANRFFAILTTLAVLAAAAFPQILAATAKAEEVPLANALGSSARLEFAVAGMTCAACAVAVKKALEKTPEVSEARVDYDAGRAIVWLKLGTVNSAAVGARVEAVIEEQGFNAQKVISPPVEEPR